MRRTVAQLLLFSLIFAPAAHATEPNPEALRRQGLARILPGLLARTHLSRHPLDDEISVQAFDALVDRMDPGKRYLLRHDVESLAKYRQDIDDELKSGTLTVANASGALLSERVKAVATMVTRILSAPLSLKRPGLVEADAKKLDWCVTDQALEARWRNRLTLAVYRELEKQEAPPKSKRGSRVERRPQPDSARPASARPDSASQKETSALASKPLAEREVAARAAVAKRYAGRFRRLSKTDRLDESERVINTVLSVYDPHSSWLPPRVKEDFDIRFKGRLEGIGAVLRESDEGISVDRVVPGGAAWHDGRLQAGDEILAVAQQNKPAVDVVGMPLRDAVRLIRGPRGTVVTLTIRNAETSQKLIDITRDVIEIEANFAKGAVLRSRKGGPSVGYIDLPSFYGGFSRGDRLCILDVARLLWAFQDQQVAGVILDLRGDGGGLLAGAVGIAGQFFDAGPVVQVQGAGNEKSVLRDTDGRTAFSGPLVVLVDRFSASASEIVAAALQDNARAVIVGTSATHGKGTVQMMESLDQLFYGRRPKGMPGLGYLKLTRQQFFRTNGESTQRLGVTPDILLADPWAHIESGERFLEHALPARTIASVPVKRWPHRPDLAALRVKSLARQKTVAAFTRATRRVAYFKATRKDSREPLNFETWKTRRHAQKARLKALAEPDNPPLLLDAQPVVYDGPPADREPQETVNRRLDWAKSRATDPWLAESFSILQDMIALEAQSASP